MSNHHTWDSDQRWNPAGDALHPDLPGSEPFPDSIYALGLENALDELMRKVRDMTPVSTTILFDEWDPLVDTDQICHVYQIVSEAVLSAVFNGRGHHIVISLRRNGCEREICVHDDGDGLAMDAGAMRRMVQWAERLEGKLAAENRATKGTAIRLTFSD